MQTETCQNCGRIIGNLETRYLFQGNIVCVNCDANLRSAKPSPPTVTAPVHHKQPSAKVWIPIAHGPGLVCQQCGGKMKQKKVTVGSHLLTNCLALIFIVIGIIVCLTVVGLIIGIPLILMALFMTPRKKKVWRCVDCRAIVDRG